MNPLAEKAIKEAYESIKCIVSNDKIDETCNRRMFFLGVINTLHTVGLITIDEYLELEKEKDRNIPYPSL